MSIAYTILTMHSKQQWKESYLAQTYWDNCSLFLASVGMSVRCCLIQLSDTRLGMTVWCCLRCLPSSNSCPINLRQSRQTESEKWRPACANINPKFPASVPSWPWFGMTSICWLAAHISLQIVWARLICFYARLVQNVMPRYLLGALPMWCRVASDRQEGEEKEGDWGWLFRCSRWYMKSGGSLNASWNGFTADMSRSGRT